MLICTWGLTLGPHIHEEDLELYSMHRLKGEALERAEGHLLACSECRAKLKDTDEYIRKLKNVLNSELSKEDDVS